MCLLLTSGTVSDYGTDRCALLSKRQSSQQGCPQCAGMQGCTCVCLCVHARVLAPAPGVGRVRWHTGVPDKCVHVCVCVCVITGGLSPSTVS